MVLFGPEYSWRWFTITQSIHIVLRINNIIHDSSFYCVQSNKQIRLTWQQRRAIWRNNIYFLNIIHGSWPHCLLYFIFIYFSIYFLLFVFDVFCFRICNYFFIYYLFWIFIIYLFGFFDLRGLFNDWFVSYLCFCVCVCL